MQNQPGPVILFGSGETSPSGQKGFDAIFRMIPASPRVALLETPAGFELNSPRVVGRVADFLRDSLQNYQPQTEIVAARRRDGPFSTESPEVVVPLRKADLTFMGPGSPTYAVKQLRGSLAWQTLIARHRMGGAVALASAAVIAASAYSVPVYEIYKVGEDPFWADGLDFFAPYGLKLALVPHWNNNDGGSEVDTSHCFMGLERFQRLQKTLPEAVTVVGLDEKTALMVDFEARCCQVIGQNGVTILRNGVEKRFVHRQELLIEELGPYKLPDLKEGVPEQVWQDVRSALAPQVEAGPDEQVQALLEARQQARLSKDWAAADDLRNQMSELGWQVKDTPEGQKIERSSTADQ